MTRMDHLPDSDDDSLRAAVGLRNAVPYAVALWLLLWLVLAVVL